MKTLNKFLLSTMLATSFTSAALAQEHEHGEDREGQMMDMMADPGTRSMMMENIANNPELRHQMMHKMMQSMNMDMHQMMNNPEMKARMQMHVQMMQAMMESEGMDQAKMKEMMDNPEMKEMMQMHMMSMQMMNGGMMGEHSESENSNQAHEEH